MAKKNFLNNPALKFISLPQEQDTATAPAEPEQQNRLDELQTIIPEGYKLEKITEKRTKRIQLVIEPSLYDKLKTAAGAAGVSVNEYAIQALNEKIKGDN